MENPSKQTPDHALRTRAAARIIGPLLLIVGVWIVARGARMDLLLSAFFQDGALVLITAIFTLLAGLTLFALHHHWDSPAAIAISTLALAAVFRGMLLLLAPELGAAAAAAVTRAAPMMVLMAAFTLLLGGWLAWVGWSRRV